MLNNRVLFNVERPTSIALIDPFILESFDGHQMLRQVYHKPQHLVIPQNTFQRCFNQFYRITQTRHDGSVNKNQPDSQILWACSQYRVDRGGGDGRGTSVRTLTMPLIWQKPGIGSTVYPLSPVLQMEPAWKGHPKYMMIPSMERAVTMDTT